MNKNGNISPKWPSPSPSEWHDANPRLIFGCSKLCAKISSLPGQNLRLQHLKLSKYERWSAFLMSTRLWFQCYGFGGLAFQSCASTHLQSPGMCAASQRVCSTKVRQKIPTMELLKRKDRQAWPPSPGQTPNDPMKHQKLWRAFDTFWDIFSDFKIFKKSQV